MAKVNQPINRYQHYDANSNAGYGRLTPKFHQPRSFVQYPEPIEYDESAMAEIDDETYKAVVSRLLQYDAMDQYSKNKNDPFYFVGSATKLGEGSSGTMVPFPRMYKSKQAIAGGTGPKYPTGPTVGFQSRARPTGTKRGFSAAPYPSGQKDDFDEPLGLTDIITTDLDQRHVDLVKKLVNLIHLEQQQ